MNRSIRAWIESKQPWRKSPTRSVYGGPIGAPHARAPNSDVLKYFARQGIAVEGRLFEDLLEAELFLVLEKVASWMPEKSREHLDDSIAFGAARTLSPNASATEVLDGYAILFDYTFDTLLIATVDVHLAWLSPTGGINTRQLPLALNTAIAAVFFRRAMLWSPIPDTGFEHREVTDSWVWLMTVFLVCHEIGHVMCDHFRESPTRHATFGKAESLAVAAPDHKAEFEADAYAIEHMFRGDFEGGLLRVGADRTAFWNAAYMTIGWLFSVFAATELLGSRLGSPVQDSHPSGVERWRRVSALIRERAPINAQTVDIERRSADWAMEAALHGPLPPLIDGLGDDDDDGKYVAVPYRKPRPDVAPQWRPPPPDVFMSWIEATSPEQARAILEAHAELLHPNVDLLHYLLADRQEHELSRAHILAKRLPLLQRARTLGIATAFELLRRYGLPPQRPILPDFEVPVALLEEYGAALSAGDDVRMNALVESSPELAAFVRFDETALALVNTTTPAETRQFIDDNPVLLIPTADLVMRRLAGVQTSNGAAERVDSFRAILARARVVGVARALVEARVQWGVDDEGKPLIT